MRSHWYRLICGVLLLSLTLGIGVLALPRERTEPEDPLDGVIESFPPALAGSAAQETEPSVLEEPETEETTEPTTEPEESTEDTEPTTAPPATAPTTAPSTAATEPTTAATEKPTDPTQPSETQAPSTAPTETNPGPTSATSETTPGPGPVRPDPTGPTSTDVTRPGTDPDDPTVPVPSSDPNEDPVIDPTGPTLPTDPWEDSDPVIMTDLSNREIAFSELENNVLKFYAYIRGGSSELYLRVNLRNANTPSNGINLAGGSMDYSAILTPGKNFFTLYIRKDSEIVSYTSFVINYVADKATEENPTVGSNPPSISTNLDSGITEVKNDSFRLFVTARTYLGAVIYANCIQVRLDGRVVPVANGWSDPEYELEFEAPIDSDSSIHTVTVTAWDDDGNSRYVSYTLTYTSVSDGGVIGTGKLVMDATTLGLGWLDDPYYFDIQKNTPLSVYVLQMLDDYGYYASYSGSAASQFYLRRIYGADIGRGVQIPDSLMEKLRADGINYTGSASRDSIGEFDYTTASGWMFSLNGTLYPNEGMDSTYLSDGDTVYLRFTLAYGKDIGGGSNQGNLSTYCGTWLNGSYNENHRYDDGAVIREPGCEEEGVFAKTCKVTGCGHQMAQPIEVLGHDEVLTGHQDPAEHEDGFDEYTCQRCGKVRLVILPKTGEDLPPTEPEPTETDPSVPEPTETEPTEPEPTVTEPSEPQPSEPEPSEPPVDGDRSPSIRLESFGFLALLGFGGSAVSRSGNKKNRGHEHE